MCDGCAVINIRVLQDKLKQSELINSQLVELIARSSSLKTGPTYIIDKQVKEMNDAMQTELSAAQKRIKELEQQIENLEWREKEAQD